MDGSTLARTVLTIDGAGCLAAGAVLALDSRVGDLIHPAPSWRAPAAAALAGTGLLLLKGAATGPSARDLTSSAAMNAGWVAVCAAAAPKARPGTGAALLAATALLDGVLGAVQWRLAESMR